MPEPSSQENTGVIPSRKTLKGRLAPYSVFIRLSIAFVCGLFFAFLATQIASLQWVDYTISEIIIYSSPLLIGIIAALTIVRRNTYLPSLALGTGVCTWLGIYVYLLPGVANSDAQNKTYCATHSCHYSGIGITLLNFYLLYGIILVLLGSGVTVLIIKGLRRIRRTREIAHTG
jgi:hypothetical protein